MQSRLNNGTSSVLGQAHIKSNSCYHCSTRGHRAGHGPARSGPLRLPDWQLVPGTRFVVDKFGGRAYEAAPNTKHWFLTHFHADHYGGLGPRFKQGEP